MKRLDATEQQIDKFSSELERLAAKEKIPQTVEELLENNFELAQKVVENRGYRALQGLLKATFKVDAKTSTLKAYMSKIRKKVGSNVPHDPKQIEASPTAASEIHCPDMADMSRIDNSELIDSNVVLESDHASQNSSTLPTAKRRTIKPQY